MRDGLLASAGAVVLLAAGPPARAGVPPPIETGFNETRFEEVEAAERLARVRLATNSRDATNALLALTVTAGMRPDYASLIDKRPLDSLKRIRESEGYAKSLLAMKPEAADAYLALGAANYILVVCLARSASSSGLPASRAIEKQARKSGCRKEGL
jgi:hypothetical protein